MTKFTKTNFHFDGCYLMYGFVGMRDGQYVNEATQFVARFKYKASGRGSFQTFLIKNFTVEEYFGRIEAGEAPLTILESKGYVQPHVAKILKAKGYPVTPEGKMQMIRDEIAARQARAA